MAWVYFFFVSAVVCLFLFIPGYLINRLIGLSPELSILVAPLISIFCFTASAIVLEQIGIFANFATIVLPWILFGFISLFVMKAVKVRRADSFDSKWVLYALFYVIIALVVSAIYFLKPLDGPSSFAQGPDNTAHLSIIRSFVNSGKFSPLHCGYYKDAHNFFADPIVSDSGSFYPASWHIVAALGVSLFSCSVPLAVNSTLFIFVSVVFPLSVFLLFRVLFEDDRQTLLVGSLITLAFEAFPWRFFIFGPLFSNFAAFTLVPSVVALMILFMNKSSKGRRWNLLTVSVIGLFALVFLQTNAVFTAGVMIAPLIINSVFRFFDKRSAHILVPCFTALLTCVLICFIWKTIHDSSFMAGVVSYPWPSFGTFRQELVNILFLGYKDTPVQPLLALCVLIGFIRLICQVEYRWVSISYLLCCVLCLFAALSNDDVRSMVIGFWYTDAYRIAAMTAISGLPLAAFGASTFLSASVNFVKSKLQISAVSSIVFCGLVFVSLIYYPSFKFNGFGNVSTSFGEFERDWFATNHNGSHCVLDYEEQRFLSKASVITKDSLVLNKPDDGSVFGYGAFNINLFYRRTGLEAYNSDTEASKLIRNSLSSYSFNNEVKDAVKKTGAQYLIVLDQGKSGKTKRYWYDHYYKDMWLGIDDVNDDTLGFECVLSEGDMRLYKIVD